MSRSDGSDTLTRDAQDALDRAIERTVREIVAVDPPDSLTRHVIARIGSADEARRGRSRAGWWPLAAGLAAAAVIVFAIAVSMKPAPVVPQSGPRVAAAPAASPASSQGGSQQAGSIERPQPDTTRVPITVNTVRVTRVRRSVNSNAGTTANGTLEPSIAIIPLAGPEAIALKDIAPASVETPQPLEIPKMEIAPIDVNVKAPDGSSPR